MSEERIDFGSLLLACVPALTISVVGVVIAMASWCYLTAYGPSSVGIALFASFVSVITAALVLRALVVPLRQRARKVATAVSILLWVTVAGSLAHGRVTYARFGLTVYGLIPVPVLDITVDSHGMLWFRDKTHQITLEEVSPLLDVGTEIVLIGRGWEGAAIVDPAVLAIEGVEIQVMNTEEAFAAYHDLKEQGRRVALLVHTTC
jgi:hypothetical protein